MADVPPQDDERVDSGDEGKLPSAQDLADDSKSRLAVLAKLLDLDPESTFAEFEKATMTADSLCDKIRSSLGLIPGDEFENVLAALTTEFEQIALADKKQKVRDAGQPRIAEKIVAKATAEFNGSPQLRRLTSKRAFTNMHLQEAGFDPV